MDLAAHQRLVTRTGTHLVRAWAATVRHVREQNPPDELAARLHVLDPLRGLDVALGAYATHVRNAFATAGQAATHWLGTEIDPPRPRPVRKKLLAFNATDDQVMTWAERNRLNLVSGVGMEQRSLIRAALIAMDEDGRNPKDVAREIYDSIGLAPAQDAAVRSYRRALERGQYGDALERELSHGGSDRAIAAAARAGRALTPEQIDTAVSRYRDNFHRLRAETILRTEGSRVVNQATDEAFRQAIANGAVDADQLEQTWHHSPSAKSKDERPHHKVMHGQTVAWGEPFVSGLGNELRFPCDPEAPPEETINCRCARTVRVAGRGVEAEAA